MWRVIFILTLFPIVGFSQQKEAGNDVFKFWSEYISDCNQLVPDTIEQDGVVKCNLVPVKMNSKIVSYDTVPIDTTWTNVECKEYKYYGDIQIGGHLWVTGTTNVATVGTGTYYSEPTTAKNTFEISRKKICWIKKRKPSWDDFWDRYLVENKIIKF